MRLLNTTDVKLWAETIECEYLLPHLVRKLIIATIDINSIKSIQFAYGEEVQTGGYDGELLSDSENLFVPIGESVWEFGTTNKKKAKADEDYQKRKDNPLGKDPKSTTYVNVNGKKYRDKKAWVNEKTAENFWKEVRYIDAVDIDQWLEIAPSVELWLAEKLGKPTFGIYSVEEYWRRWSDNKKIKILPQIIAGNSRKKEVEKVKSFLQNKDNVLYIKSITKDEALIFPVAIIEQMDAHEKTSLSIKTLIVDNRESFNRIIQSKTHLIIIAKFKAESTDITGALHCGHKLIVPLSPSDEVGIEKIDLPIVSNDDFENGLISMGIDSEQARLLTKNTGRNISVLRRTLELDYIKPKWMDSINLVDIIPILLANRFSENSIGDKEIIEYLSGKKYSEYENFLKILLNQEDTPVYHINGVWRLISPTDIWLYVAKYLSKNDFENLQKTCISVLSEVSNKYSIPLNERGVLLQTPENVSKFSGSLKEGLSETLAIISIFGSKYEINDIKTPESFIDTTVNQILEKDVVVWRSLSSNLMILAEASPTIFLNNLERIIRDKSVVGFFEEQSGFLYSSNDLSPMLWCLNIIGWMPENLMRVSIALCELINLSPDKLPTANTPYETFKSIYRIWYPQTNASAEERKLILEILLKKYPDIMFNIIYNMIASNNDSAMHVPRPMFRLFSELRNISVTYNEISYLRRFCLDSIIELSLNDLGRILMLVDLLDDIDWDKINNVLIAIESGLTFDSEMKNTVYQKFRGFIGNHRNYPDARWALSSDTIDTIEVTALKFKTDDYILNEKYLFEGHYPILLSGKNGNDYEKQEQEILELRKGFVGKIIADYGIEKVFELAEKVEHSDFYGQALANLNSISADNKLKVYQLIDSENPKFNSLANRFIRVSEYLTDRETQIDVLKKLIGLGISMEGIVKFLLSLNCCIELWEYIQFMQNDEVESLYWKSQQGLIYTDEKKVLIFALEKLHIFKKSILFLNVLGLNIRRKVGDDFTSEEILELLEKVILNDFEDEARLDYHNFENILDILYSRDDYDEERGAKVELKFYFVFKGYHSPKPQNLFKLMSKKPSEYMGILSQIYLPDDEKLREEELEKIERNDNSRAILEFSYQLFDKFDYIPSLNRDNILDAKELNLWVNEVRSIAKDSHRERVTDSCIGKLLAKCPINMEENQGYPVEIYDLIEKINSDSMKSAFEMQISNNLGVTSRGAFEGGNIERYRASYFNNLFDKTKITHPNVSIIFKNLSKRYIQEGNWEDDNALLRSLS